MDLTSKKETRRAYRWMVIPPFIIYLFVLAFPVFLSIVLSLSDFRGGKFFEPGAIRIVGFGQYAKLFSDPYFWHALRNNIYIVLISVFGQLSLGLFLAYLIYRRIVKAGAFWQGILYVPSVISVIVIGIMWNLIFSPSGPLAEIVNRSNYMSHKEKIGRILDRYDYDPGLEIPEGMISDILGTDRKAAQKAFDDPVQGISNSIMMLSDYSREELASGLANLLCRKWDSGFLNRDGISMLPILFVTLWCWTGMYLIIFLANMQKINKETIESAMIDGAKERSILFHIIVPELQGTIMNCVVLCISGSLNSFALIYSMTGGGPARITQVLAIYMYEKAFMGTPDYPLANAISMMMVFFSLILILITRRFEKAFGVNR
ncbi:MAG: sugar ABC transporter permease, partial [Spirochaetales bacterium]|nr:sugar ABC transporter permease [Spirochaetales bacterium]